MCGRGHPRHPRLGLSHRTTSSMFTEIEGDWDEVMAVVRDATMALADQASAPRWS